MYLELGQLGSMISLGVHYPMFLFCNRRKQVISINMSIKDWEKSRKHLFSNIVSWLEGFSFNVIFISFY